MKALIIDDEPHVITVARILVTWERFGIHTVLSCSSSEEALDLIAQESPQIILSDINLPGLSGLDLIEKLRNSGSTAQVILITAYSDFAFAQRAVKLDCVDYLLKPLSEQALNTAVDKAVSLYRESIRMQELLSAQQEPESTKTPFSSFLYPQDEASTNMNIHQICQKIHEALEEHYQEEINLDILGKHWNVSSAYLSRSYKKEMGMGLIDDLTRIRIREACHRMESDMRTSDIALAVGISDPKYFSRVFKKSMGMTPAEYRDRLHKNGNHPQGN